MSQKTWLEFDYTQPTIITATMVYGARQIAQALADLDVKVIFGLPGLPVIDIAQEAMNLGIRFISFRNEQASVYAASAYGYLTGKPGVCISVGGPGMLHVIAGVGDCPIKSVSLGCMLRQQ